MKTYDTRTQSLNPNCKLHCAGIITASQALSAYQYNISNPSITFINMIMQYIVLNVKAIKYGREHEGLARTCSMFFRTTTRIQPELDIFDESRFVTPF